MRSLKLFVLTLAGVALGQACSSKSAFQALPDATASLGGATDSGGGAGSGGNTTGSSGGAGGNHLPDASLDSGGMASSGGMPSTGGTASKGGTTGTGGAGGISPGSGGRSGTGGAIVGAGGAGGIGDAGPSVCSCQEAGRDSATASSIVLSWDCYCQAYNCDFKLDAYKTDGGYMETVIAVTEYSDCGLVVVTTRMASDPILSHVFDKATGRLVGNQLGTDVTTRCPFNDAGSFWKLSAGQFPSATCKVTSCTPGSGPLASCGSGGSDGSSAGGSGGAGGAGGAGG